MMKKMILCAAVTPLFLLAACGEGDNSNAVAAGDQVKLTNLGFTLKDDATRMPEGIEPIEGSRMVNSIDSPIGKSGGRRQNTNTYVKNGERSKIIEHYKKALEAKEMEVETSDFGSNSRIKATSSNRTVYVNVSEPRNQETYVSLTVEYPSSELDFPTIVYPSKE